MRVRGAVPIVLVLLALACGDDQSATSGATTEVTTEATATGSGTGETAEGTSDGSGSTTGPPVDPSWSKCFSPFGSTNYLTCEAACAAEGRLCRARGCGGGKTVEGFVFGNCSGLQGSQESECTDNISLVANAFHCCCV